MVSWGGEELRRERIGQLGSEEGHGKYVSFGVSSLRERNHKELLEEACIMGLAQ